MEYLLSREEVAMLNELSIAEHKKLSESVTELVQLAARHDISVELSVPKYQGLIYRANKLIENRMILSKDLYDTTKAQPQKMRKEAANGINAVCTQSKDWSQ